MSRTLNDATRRRMGIVANIAALTVAFIKTEGEMYSLAEKLSGLL